MKQIKLLLIIIISLAILYNINYTETFAVDTFFKPKIIITTNKEIEQQTINNNDNPTNPTNPANPTNPSNPANPNHPSNPNQTSNPNQANQTNPANPAVEQQPDNSVYNKSLLGGSYKYIGCYRDYPENYYTRRLKEKVDTKPISIEDCNNYAVNTGYKIYGLQNFDIISGKGDCYVGNDLIRATNFDSNNKDNKDKENSYINGDCLDYQGYTVGGKNSNALYTSYGPTYEYLGCFKENKDKIKMDENKRHLRFSDCQGAAHTNNYKYYGIKDWGILHSLKGNCFLTNNFDENINLEQGTCITAKAHTIANDLSILNDRIVGVRDNYAIYKRLDIV